MPPGLATSTGIAAPGMNFDSKNTLISLSDCSAPDSTAGAAGAAISTTSPDSVNACTGVPGKNRPRVRLAKPRILVILIFSIIDYLVFGFFNACDRNYSSITIMFSLFDFVF
jgi:hypothetical protein